MVEQGLSEFGAAGYSLDSWSGFDRQRLGQQEEDWAWNRIAETS